VLNRKDRLTFAVMARSLADDDAWRSVTKNLSLEYEASLERVAKRFGKTVGEMDHFLWSNETDGAMK
jgi:thermostable 8-oxoguanine DNA glycosylase